jgi:hypothetical protein
MKSSVFWDNAVQSVEIQPTLPKIMSPPFSRSKNKASKPPAFSLVSYLAYSSTLKTEATCSSEAPSDFQRNIQPYIPEDRTLQVTFRVWERNKSNGYRGISKSCLEVQVALQLTFRKSLCRALFCTQGHIFSLKSVLCNHTRLGNHSSDERTGLFIARYLSLCQPHIQFPRNFICRVNEGWWERLREPLFRETPQSPSPLWIVLETLEDKGWPRSFEKFLECLRRHKIVVVKFSKVSVREASKWSCPVELILIVSLEAVCVHRSCLEKQSNIPIDVRWEADSAANRRELGANRKSDSAATRRVGTCHEFPHRAGMNHYNHNACLMEC